MKNQDRVVVSAHVDREFREKAKIALAKERISMRNFIIRCFEDLIKKHNV